MEPAQATLKVYLGEFEVVQTSLNSITLNVGKKVHVTIYINISHDIKPGDKLPLFTEMTYAHAGQTSEQ